MTTILGIDPGLTGALAWLNADGRLLEVRDMPVLAGEVSSGLLRRSILARYPDRAVVEFAGFNPKNGAKANRSTGMTLGIITACLDGVGVTEHRVAPGVWKRQMGLTSDKARSRALAIRQWPEWADSFRRVKDDGRAEAALIAWWWLTKKVAGTQMEVV